jgi:hypothetical protein
LLALSCVNRVVDRSARRGRGLERSIIEASCVAAPFVVGEEEFTVHG